MARQLVLGFFGSFLIGAACGGTGAGAGTDGGDCPVGSEGCACTGGGVCDPDLECIDNVCTGPDACPVGSPGCACTGGGACDPNLTCTSDICRLPDGCAVGSQGCGCTGGGACDPGLLCTADVCTPDPGATTTGNTSNSSSDSATTGVTTDPTATATTGTTGVTTDPTASTTGATATTNPTDPTTAGSTGGQACSPGEKGCSCNGTSCDDGLMCMMRVCMNSASPLAHWNFENNLDDVSGNGYDGLGNLTITYGASPTGLAAVVDGNNFIDISTFTSAFTGISDSFTLAMRMKGVTAGGQDHHLFGQGHGGENLLSNAFGVWYNGADHVVFQMTETGNTGSDKLAILGPNPAEDTWTDLVFVFESPTVEFYMDGDFVNEVIYTDPDTQSLSMWIGGFPNLTYNVDGMIDDVQVFSGSLTK